MRPRTSAILVALFASCTIGVLHAQTKPRGYAIVETDVTNADAFAREYLPAASKVIAEAGGKFLLRGGRSVTVEGDPPKRLSIVEFETFEQAKAMFDSAAYKAAGEIGHKYAKFRITVVEGLPPQ
jgi:uncharacterized protein (DUF1330 family)